MNKLDPRQFYAHLSLILQSKSSLSQKNHHRAYKQLVFMRRATEFVMITLMQYVGLMLGTVPDEPIPVWPASGVAIAMLFFRGYRIWPGLMVGSFLAYSIEGHALDIALCASLVHVLEAITIRFSVLRIIGPFIPLQRARAVLEFFLIGLGISFLSSGILSALATPDTFWAEPVRMQWMVNWIADFGGIIIFAPACLIWDAYLPNMGTRLNRHPKRLQAYTLIATLFSINFVLLFLSRLEHVFILNIATMPLILMAAYYFGQCGATIAAAFTAMIAVCNFDSNYEIFSFDGYHVYFLSLQFKFCLEAGMAFYFATRRAELMQRFSKFG